MITLLQEYGDSTQELHYSLKTSGYNAQTIVVEDDGFLPDDVISPFSFYTDSYKQKDHIARNFAQIPVPKFWEIAGNGTDAQIKEYDVRRAIMVYNKQLQHKRIVSKVHWLDRTDRIRVTDHYNRYGFRFAQESHDKEGQVTMKSYFNIEGQEVVVENRKTGNIFLNYNGKTKVFESLTFFLLDFLQTNGFNLDHILYNNLSYPMFVNTRLPRGGEDFFFFDEDFGDELPGNLVSLLEDPNSRTKHFFFRRKNLYDKAYNQFPQYREKISYLGNIYDFKRENSHQAKVYTFTNSDDVLHAETLIQSLPDVHFTVSARTEMSTKLLGYQKYGNVSLYANIGNNDIAQQWVDNDIYLDNNYGNEMMDAIKQAFINNQLIVGFKGRRHNPRYGLDELYFEDDDVDGMRKLLARVTDEPVELDRLLERQRQAADLATIEDYKNAIRV